MNAQPLPESTQTFFNWRESPFGVSRYPAVAGHRRRHTSRAAAAAMQPRQGKLQERVLAALSRSSMTADEIAEWLHETPFSVRPRCSELALPTKKRPALIRDSGETRLNVSGKPAIVWEVIAP